MVIKKEVEEKLKNKTKKISVKEGISASVMEGAGMKYITPYALALGASNAQIGFLSSIPSLLGNFSQILTSKAIEKYSRKKIITIGVFLQALMWIPIIVVGYFFFYRNVTPGLSATLIILFYTLFTLFGSFISPAWNSLMKDIVVNRRGDYFGNRHKITGVVVLLVMLVCGFILNFFHKRNLFIGFLILFSIAFFARIFSAYFFTKHYEPKLKLEGTDYFSFWKFIKNIPQSNFGKFAVGISLISLGTYIASPFFAVYMLKNLQFNYAVWTLVVVFNLFSTLISMPFWGKLGDKYGNLKILRWTGALIPLVPLFWFFTFFIIKINLPIVLPYLLIVEFFSGFIWAGFNLSAANFIYDAVTREKLALCISYYNILNGMGVFIGATIGGWIASTKLNIFGVGPILFIFLLSALMRFLFYLLTMPKIKEVREVGKYKDAGLKKEIKKVLSPIPFKIMRYNGHI